MIFNSRWLRTFVWTGFAVLSAISIRFAPVIDSPIFWTLSMVFCLFYAYLEFLVSALFISPGKAKLSLKSPSWTSHYPTFDSKVTHIQLYHQNETAPFVVFIHGWRGSSVSVSQRAQLFIDKGWHVAIIELPGHGSSSPLPRWNAITASKHIQFHLKSLDSILESRYVSHLFFYGHSMGGYICTRISREPEIIPYQIPLNGLILESPLLLYSNIAHDIIKRLRIPKFIRPLHMKRVFRDVAAMHPDVDVLDGLKQFDIPLWGVPSVPTLCLQAMNDKHLGRDHYNAAVSEFTGKIPFTHHLIESLSHSGARKNEEREALLLEWLEEFDSLLLK